MKYLLVFALLLSLSAPVLASTRIFPDYPIPVPATQGGTGQTSFTTNCLIAATSSTALGCTATPTVSGANITAIDKTTCGTWTPTDLSGASLTFTVNSAVYCHTVHSDGTFSVTMQLWINFPVNASGAAASISLPYNVVTGPYWALPVGYNTSAVVVGAAANGAMIALFNIPSSGGGVANSVFSGFSLMISGTYQSAS